jgi:cytidylate kinase
MMRKMIITLDGPAASGKTTVGKLLAKNLGFDYLYSGFLYRAISHILLLYEKCSATDLSTFSLEYLEKVLTNIPIEYCFVPEGKSYITIAGKRIENSDLMTPEIDKAASMLGSNTAVRQLLTEVQRKLVVGRSVVVDGRDAGSIVFPEADYKFFLTASLAVRAARYVKRQQEKFDKASSIKEAEQIITERDMRDGRWLTGIDNVPDVITIDTSDITQEDVVQRILEYIDSKKQM